MNKLTLCGLIICGITHQSYAIAIESYSSMTECYQIEAEIANDTTLSEKVSIYRKQENCFKQFKYYQVTPPPSVLKLSAPVNISGEVTSSAITEVLAIQPSQTKVNAKAVTEAENAKEKGDSDQSKSDFLGLNFGYGFALVHYNDELVDKATVVNGIIVAESTKENEAKIVLEFHSIKYKSKDENSGHGPFAALLVGDGDILNGLGFGWLYATKNTQKNSDSGSGFSFGLGVVIENDVKQLADGFKVGGALPTGETDVRYIEKDEISSFLFMSSNF